MIFSVFLYIGESKMHKIIYIKLGEKKWIKKMSKYR